MNGLTTGGQAATMTSLELVNFINDRREQQAEQSGQPFPSEEFPELTHANLLAKIPKVLGGTSHSFECDLPDSYGRPRRGYRLPKREACLMAMSYSYDLQAAVFDHMTALESKLKSLPDVSSHEGALLALQGSVAQQLVLIGENKQLAAERDQAIATKALIGSKREASAMATASSAVRQVRQLENELGRGCEQATVIAVEGAARRRFGKQGFRPLQAWCKSRGIQPNHVHDPRYGRVCAWPAAAWADVYQIDLSALFGADGENA